MTAVLTALHEARAAAGMAVTRKVPAPGVTSVGPHRGVPGFLGRYRELVELGEDDDPTAVLVALVQAKVAEHAASDDEKKRGGQYAVSTSLTRDVWWPGNLAAARGHLARPRPKPTTIAKPRPSYTAIAEALGDL